MSTERREFDREAKEKGRLARKGRVNIHQNPYPAGSRPAISFIAGWVEADKNIQQGTEMPFAEPGVE